MKHHITIPRPEHIASLHDLMSNLSSEHQLFCFQGEMGAGKTTLIKGVCAAFGVDPDEMSSPTFAIVNEYQGSGQRSIFHFDLYRIENPDELVQIGWEDYLMSNSLIFIEWPEKAWDLIPDDAVIIKIAHEPDSDARILEITTP